MTLDEIYAKVSSETGIPKTIVAKAYRAFWRAIRNHVISLPLKEDLTDEEFLALQPNINIPSIGKMCITLERYRKIKEHHKIWTGRQQEQSNNTPN